MKQFIKNIWNKLVGRQEVNDHQSQNPIDPDVKARLMRNANLIRNSDNDIIKEDISELIDHQSIIDQILNSEESLEDTFNSLPLSSISDNAKLEIIKIVQSDHKNRVSGYDQLQSWVTTKINKK